MQSLKTRALKKFKDFFFRKENQFFKCFLVDDDEKLQIFYAAVKNKKIFSTA